MGGVDKTGLTLFVTRIDTEVAWRLKYGMENEGRMDKEGMFVVTIRLKTIILCWAETPDKHYITSLYNPACPGGPSVYLDASVWMW